MSLAAFAVVASEWLPVSLLTPIATDLTAPQDCGLRDGFGKVLVDMAHTLGCPLSSH
jgi:hypothetical protein